MAEPDEMRTRLRRGTPEERSRAVRALARRTPPPTDALREAAGDDHPTVRVAAVEALAATAGEEAGSTIADAVLDTDREVRLAAIDACADLGLERAIGSLTIAVESDEDEAVRAAAARALGAVGGNETVPGLLTALDDAAIADAARDGLACLEDVSSATATERLLDRLEDALATNDRGTADAIATALRRVTDPAAIRAVREREEASDDLEDAIGRLEYYDRTVTGHGLVSKATLTSPDPYVRRDAADEAGRVLLDERINGTDRLETGETNRFETVGTLVSQLLDLLDDEYAYVRREAALSLLAAGDQRAVEPLCRMLDRAIEEEDDWTIQVAHWALQLLEPGRDVEVLVHELKFERGFEGTVLGLLAHRTRQYVGRFPYVDAITRLRARRQARRAVADAEPGERDSNDVAMLALTATADDVSQLHECLDDPDELVRAQAALALGHVGISWRRLGASALGRRAGGTIDDFGGERDDRVVAALLDRLEDEPEALVVARLVDALGMHGATAAVDPLIELLEADDDRCRETAATALGRIGDPDATTALGRLVRTDEAERVRTAAATALGVIEDERGVDALADALAEDDSSRVRERAARALGRIDSPATQRALEEARQVDPDADVRTAAHGASARAWLRRSRVGTAAVAAGGAIVTVLAITFSIVARLYAPVSGPLSVVARLLWGGVQYVINVVIGWLVILAALVGLAGLVWAISLVRSVVL